MVQRWQSDAELMLEAADVVMEAAKVDIFQFALADRLRTRAAEVAEEFQQVLLSGVPYVECIECHYPLNTLDTTKVASVFGLMECANCGCPLVDPKNFAKIEEAA